MCEGRILTADEVLSKKETFIKCIDIDHLESVSRDVLDLIATIDALVIERNASAEQLEDEYGPQREYDHLRKPGILDGYKPEQFTRGNHPLGTEYWDAMHSEIPFLKKLCSHEEGE